jgi:hypothetical protein
MSTGGPNQITDLPDPFPEPEPEPVIVAPVAVAAEDPV